jgi:hypothetical protein
MVVLEPPDGGVVVEGELGVVVWALATPAAASSVASVMMVRFIVAASLSAMDPG